MWKGWRRGGGCCSTTWTSWCTCSTPSCASFTSSSGCGATPRCSPGARATTGRKDDLHADGSGGGGGGARGRDPARGAVLRAEQGAVPELRLPDHPDRSLRGVLLSGRAGGRARRGPDGGTVVFAPVARPAPRVSGTQADHLVRLTVGLPTNQRHQR